MMCLYVPDLPEGAVAGSDEVVDGPLASVGIGLADGDEASGRVVQTIPPIPSATSTAAAAATGHLRRGAGTLDAVSVSWSGVSLPAAATTRWIQRSSSSSCSLMWHHLPKPDPGPGDLLAGGAFTDIERRSDRGGVPAVPVRNRYARTSSTWSSRPLESVDITTSLTTSTASSGPTSAVANRTRSARHRTNNSSTSTTTTIITYDATATIHG